jgi:WD40 repeat protein
MPAIVNPRPNPYPGPSPFRRDQKLYGRDRETWELSNLLIAERIVLLYSPSGAGKTSLIQSALAPELEREEFRLLPPMRTGFATAGKRTLPGNPFTLSLLQSLEQRLAPDQRWTPEQLSSYTLQTYLEQRLEPRSRDQCGDLLIFDQFEEIFTSAGSGSEYCRQFFDDVSRALQDPHRWALFSMREEFIASLDPYARLMPGRFAARYRLQLLDRNSAVQAIRQPAKAVDVAYSDSAVDKLVSDLLRVDAFNLVAHTPISANDYVEPVHLQVVCRQLWQRLRPDQMWIDEADVRAHGNVDQALTSFYEDAIRDLVEGEAAPLGERRLRRWFGRELITPASTRGLVYRGDTETAGLPNAAIERLTKAHVVREVVRGDDIWYELAHDRLVAPILAANRQWEAAYHNPLTAPTQAWLDAQRSSDKLLRGDALAQALRFTETNPEDVLDQEAEFVRESLERDQAEKSAERAAAQRRRRLRVGVGIAAGVATLLVFAILFFAQGARDANRREQQQRVLAEAAILAGGALEELYQPIPDPSKALIMAREAVSVTWRGENGFVTPLANKALVDSSAMAPPWVLSLPRQRHTDEVLFASFSADGSRILTASRDGTAKLWDAETGRPLATLVGHTGQVRSAVFSPDGRQAATAGDDAMVMVWALPDSVSDSVVLAPALLIQDHLARVRSVVFSPDGSRLLTASDDGTARLWNAISGEEVARIEDGACQVLWASYSPPGDRIVTASLETDDDGVGCALAGAVKTWDSRSYQPLIQIWGHADWVRSAVFSPDGTRLLTASDDGTARVWDAGTGAELVRIELPGFWVSSAAFSPDGALIATVTAQSGSTRRFEHSITVWDAGSGRKLGQLGAGAYPRPHFDRIWSVVFSPDGSRLLTASSDETAKVWALDQASGGGTVDIWETPVIDGHASWIRYASFSPDGARIVSAGDDHAIKIWDVASGEELITLSGHTGWVGSAVFSADGSRILSASSDGTARIWDATTGDEKMALRRSVGLFFAAFSPDETHVVTARNDGAVDVWNLSQDQPRVEVEFSINTGSVRSARYSPDGQSILVAGAEGALGVWDASTGQRLLTLEGHDPALTVYWADFSPSGAGIVSASEDGTARTWNAATGAPTGTFEGHTAGVMAAVFSLDGKQLVTAGRDTRLLVWSVETGAQLGTLTGHVGEVRSVAFSPDGRFLVSAGGDGDSTMRVWRAARSTGLVTLDAPMQPVLKSVLFSPDGALLVTAANQNSPVDFSARIWDASTGEQVHEALKHRDWVNYAAFDPDGSRVVTAVDNDTAVVWDLQNEKPPLTLTGHQARLTAANFSPNGQQIVTASWDGTARVWDAQTGQPLRLVLHHAGGVNFAAFSRDGSRIITASEDRTAKIWDAATGDEMAALVGHRSRVNSADLSPDARLAVTGSDDGTAIVWDASTGTQEHLLTGHGDAIVSVAFSPDGAQILTASRDGLAKIWDATTGQELFTPAWVDQSILFAAYKPDGSSVVTGNLYRTRTSAQYTVRVWPATVEALLDVAAHLIQRDPPVLTISERRTLGLKPAADSP